MARRNPDKQPSAKAERLADLLADQQIDLDELSAEYLPIIVEQTEKLLESTAGRTTTIWNSATADITLTLDDYAAVPVAERDDNWALQLSSMQSAAYMQAAAESGYLQDLVIISDNHSNALIRTTRKMVNSELKEIATEGVLNGKLKARKKVRGGDSG